MAQVTLTAIGSALGGPVGGAIGSTVGAMIDRAAVDALKPPRQVGPRLAGLHVSSAAEGAPMPAVFGRARIAGQMIWAARFRERRVERRTGGGKGGPRTETAAYSLSFAVALGEGPIDGVGRVWADGKPMELAGVIMRVHRGGADQAPDPLIEAVEGSAPAYRGTAYVVFEDLPLERYGNRAPQLSFEVFRRPGSALLEERLEGVCLIPGAGEFVYATEVVRRRESLTRTRAENVNNSDGRPDVLVALDQLQAQLPNLKSVTIVVSWFGDDLRAGHCVVRPGVEAEEKQTLPSAWRAGGVDRSSARLLAGADGRPAYGGTPADTTVLALIAELKRRGLKAGLYPFLMMDIASGNGLPDPYGGAEQAAYPWRGRITCHPAPGGAGSPDRTAAAGAQVEAFFGAAAAGDFTVVEGEPRYGGSDWGFSRMVLHYAKLAQLAGGVDTFLVGSELRGLTHVRDSEGYPAVRALRRLAQEARAMLPDGAISYAADWSEWFGHQPEGSGDVAFHLDPLWADPAVSFVGIDWYPPLTDWRDGGAHLDAQAGHRGTHDPAYLAAGVAGGEGFDWYYASAADRLAQVRTPITDGAHGEPWVFRPKDLVGWWSHAHHDRAGGARATEPTAWVPRSKPIRFVEFGCPAVDKGANAPNLFLDAKSAESALPPFSDGGRDDLGQRRALEALLLWFGAAENNAVSDAYDGPMLEAMDAWCWDARPFPAFPARETTWADGANWTRGHWLTGRTGVGPAAELITAVLGRGGIEPEALDLSEADGAVTGYVVDRPMTLRDALQPLLTVFGLDAAERDDRIALIARDPLVSGPSELGEDDLALADGAAAAIEESRTLSLPPSAVRARFADDAGEYAVAAVTVTGDSVGGGGVLDLELPVVTRRPAAERIARRRLAIERTQAEEATLALGPEAALRLQPGDCIRREGDERPWRVLRVDADETPRARVVPVEPSVGEGGVTADWRPGPVMEPPAPPVLHLLDLPPLSDREDARPLLAVAGEPWRTVGVSAGTSAAALTPRARVSTPAIVGVTVSELPRGPLHRVSAGALTVRVEGGVLQSRTLVDVAAGENALAVRSASGEWELVQFLSAQLVAPETYRLSGLIRAQAGSDAAMANSTPAGAAVVVLAGEPVRAEVGASERGAALLWRAAPVGGDGGSVTEASFTWRALAQRPWSPAHLGGRRQPDGALRLSWTRRARLGGDAWDGEPPLGEAQERYRVEVLDGATPVRAWEVSEPRAFYPAEQMASDFPAGAPNPLRVRVRQGYEGFGWGAAALRDLLY